jgi:hypothetical protein
MVDEKDSGTSPDMASVQAAIIQQLGLLIDGLAEGRRTADLAVKALEEAGRNDPQPLRIARAKVRRTLARKALWEVIAFIESPAVFAWCPDVMRMDLAYHLRGLFEALEDFDSSSQTPDLFELSSDRKQAPVPSAQRLRGKVAAIVELLCKAGDDLDHASEFVADALNKAGFGKPRGQKSARGDTRIKSATIKGWHRRAMEEGKDSILRDRFLSSMKLAEMRLAEGDGYGVTARKMMEMLHQDLQDGKLRIALLHGDPIPKK